MNEVVGVILPIVIVLIALLFASTSIYFIRKQHEHRTNDQKVTYDMELMEELFKIGGMYCINEYSKIMEDALLTGRIPEDMTYVDFVDKAWIKFYNEKILNLYDVEKFKD